MILRFAAALSLALGAAALLIYLDVMGHGPAADEAARHLRAMKDRRAAPAAATPVTLDDIAALPHHAPLAEVAALERRGVAIEGYIQRLKRAADDDYHLEVAMTPRKSGGPDTAYATAEITPGLRGASPRWSYGGLIAAFRPNHGGRTAWDAGPRRVRISGWLLYDFQYDGPPSEWQKQMGAPRISGWEIHPVTGIGLWDDSLGRYLDYPPVSFLNPLFLFGLAAAAIPVIIHLFTRRRPREVRFPSLEFLSEVNQSEIRRLRLRQWLLLLLRTLAVAAIALAIARPALRGSANAAGHGSGAGATIVVLVDQSGSMGTPGGSGATLLAEARRVIEDLLGSLGPEDELLLVPYDQAVHPTTPKPSSDVGRLRAAAQALEPTARATDHRGAVESAARALEASHALNRELFWISDFQSTGFAAPGATAGATFTAPPGPWDKARVYLVPLVPRTRMNVGLADVALAPTESGVALSVSAVAFGASRGDLAVEVRDARTHDDLGRGFLDLPERGETTALLPLARLPDQGGVAIIPDDPLVLDNRRVFAAGRSGTIRVLVREEGAPSAVRLALEAGSPASGIQVEAVDAATLPARLAEADVVVLNDLERLGDSELQALLDFYRSGGGLLIVLGARADPGFWNNSLLREAGAGTLGASERAAAGAAWRLLRTAAGHAVLAGFPARPGEPLTSARFQAIRALTPGAEARVLLEFDRSHPALIEAQRALVFAAGLDPADSDFPVSGAYLPLLHQAVKVLGRGTAASSLVPGDRYQAPAGTGTWRIEGEDGREVPAQLIAAGGATRLVSEPLERPGLYRVLKGGALHTTFAVNPDPRESDLGSIAEAALLQAFPPGRAQVVRPGEGLARRVREARYGRELWSWFVMLALIFLIAETVIGRWGLAETGPEGAAAETGRARAGS